MEWQVVAEGKNLWDLEQIVSDRELPKGTRMRVIMKTSIPWAFDLAGAEWAFAPFVPDGMNLVDVWGEGGQGIVEMEADPVWLAAALAFIKVHWVALTIATIIGTFVLTAIISSIIVSIRLPAAAVAGIPAWMLIGAAGGILGLVLIGGLVTKRG